MSAQMMQKIAPGWRRVATPRYKKDYKGKYVTDVRSEFRKTPPDGAVCLMERRASEGAGHEFLLHLKWRCPNCGLDTHFWVPESWIKNGRLVFVEPEEESHDDRA